VFNLYDQNPNFLQRITAPVDMPLDRLYAPIVELEIKDSMFGGLVKRLLGTNPASPLA